MQKLALVFSVFALAASGWLAWTASEASRDAKAQTESLASLDARLAALEHAAARSAASPSQAPAAATAGGAPTLPPPAATLSGNTRPASVPDLDRRLAKLERMFEEANRDGAPSPEAGAAKAQVMAEAPPEVDDTNIGSADDAQRILGLSPGQRTEFERVAAEAKKEIETLQKTPDDEGKTWEQAQKEVVTWNGGSISFDMTKVQAFREKTIPGRSESFGAAERRIAEAARKRLRDSLTPDQQAKFDKSNANALVGASTGGDLPFMTVFNSLPAINVASSDGGDAGAKK